MLWVNKESQLKVLNKEQLDKAIERHTRRRSVFVSEGLDEVMAWDLADQMLDRDNDHTDNRRVCFECENYKFKKCTASDNKFFYKFILQNCENFVLKGVKS
jgi:hypothetical protein